MNEDVILSMCQHEKMAKPTYDKANRAHTQVDTNASLLIQTSDSPTNSNHRVERRNIFFLKHKKLKIHDRALDGKTAWDFTVNKGIKKKNKIFYSIFSLIC